MTRLPENPSSSAQNLYGKQTEQGLDTAIARIEEEGCIGCTACIRVCPVDAIVGSTKMMHTIIRTECTGCTLCIPACPVDCITLDSISPQFLPQNPILSNTGNQRLDASQHAVMRYEARQERLQKNKKITQKTTQTSIGQTAIQALLNKAHNSAQSRSASGRAVTLPEELHNKNIHSQQEKAAYRRAQRQLKYGNESEKAQAITYLRSLKTTEE